MVRIMHIADVHLDSAFSCNSIRKAELRRIELRNAFSSVINKAKSLNVDIFIIAGDLFDSENVTKETTAFLNAEFENFPSCKFVITPGNHDPLTQNSVYIKNRFPDNVYIFKTNEISKFTFEDLNTEVYGFAYDGCNIGSTEVPYVKNDGTLKILVVHGDISDSAKENSPVKKRDFANAGFDYVALGHIHNGTQVEKTGNSFYAYPGCLEGRDFGECGSKGGIFCELDKTANGLNSGFQRFDFSKRKYIVERLNVTGAQSTSDIAPKIRKIITDNGYDTNTLLKIVLEGDISPEFVVKKDVFSVLADGLFYFEIKDNTRPFYDFENIKSDPTIRGAFYEELEGLLNSPDEGQRIIAQKALKYGLSALAGNDIAEY